MVPLNNYQEQSLKILFIISEADPFIKVGGLGDVAGSLPYALRSLPLSATTGNKIDIRLVIPFHQSIRKKFSSLTKIDEFDIARSTNNIPAEIFYIENMGLPVYLVDGPPFKNEQSVYNIDPGLDGEKYVFFSLACLELTRRMGWKPDIIHANDWHTAPAIYALHNLYKNDPFFKNSRTILSLHNLPFMGLGSESSLSAYNLPRAEQSQLPDWAKHAPLPLGLLTADQIVAVSPTYSREILTTEFGCGLQDFLKTRRKNLSGIINGLDLSIWDPSQDKDINTPFDCSNLDKRFQNKMALLSEVNLPHEPNSPLFIFIGRMDPQKGLDLAISALNRLHDLPWQAILLGTGVPALEEAAHDLQKTYPNRIRAVTRFDANLARRMYAGGDIILMPSRYEPCGLAQMIAMRYGCIPLARATGGLKDTIIDVQTDPINSTGFLFKKVSEPAMTRALRRAIACFSDQKSWRSLQLRAMSKDFSWENSAKAYSELYLKLKGQNI